VNAYVYPAAPEFSAIADPTRRQIFEAIAASPASVTDLARLFPISRPAVSQHLAVLQSAGLVKHRTLGTRHIYSLDPAGLAQMRDYLDSLWQRALLNFKALAEQTAPKSNFKENASPCPPPASPSAKRSPSKRRKPTASKSLRNT
jgi:DNA-binding transcriptional ArsR family regulator